MDTWKQHGRKFKCKFTGKVRINWGYRYSGEVYEEQMIETSVPVRNSDLRGLKKSKDRNKFPDEKVVGDDLYYYVGIT